MKQISIQEYKLILINKIENEVMDVDLFNPKSNGSLRDVLPGRMSSGRQPNSVWITEYKGADLHITDLQRKIDFKISDGDKLGVNVSHSGSYKKDMFGAYNMPKPIDNNDLSKRFRNADSVISHVDRMISTQFDKVFGEDSTSNTKRNLESLLDRNIEVNKEGNYEPSQPQF